MLINNPNYTDLFKDHIDKNKEQYPGMLLPRTKPIDNVPPAFHGYVYDKGYDTINFRLFIDSFFPGENLHTSCYSSSSIKNDLENAYPEFKMYNPTEFFQQFGIESQIGFREMKYYQDEIDIRGRHPFSGGIDERVWVVRYTNELVLYNGYHRASIRMLMGNDEIQGYVVRV